jgi:hypothetical protein
MEMSWLLSLATVRRRRQTSQHRSQEPLTQAQNRLTQDVLRSDPLARGSGRKSLDAWHDERLRHDSKVVLGRERRQLGAVRTAER